MIEHNGQLLCLTCLRAGTDVVARSGGGWKKWVGGPVAAGSAFVAAWFAFYAFGQALIALADSWTGGGK